MHAVPRGQQLAPPRVIPAHLVPFGDWPRDGHATPTGDTRTRAVLEDLAEQVPFARRVSELIGVSVARARQAALSALVDGTLEQFKHEVSSGVSAELCRAIALLGSGRNDADVEISVAYGGVMARAPSAPVVSSGDAFQVLEDAARFLVDQAPRDRVEVEGLVVEMDQPITGQRRLEGDLTIGAVIDGKVRKIRVTLQEPDYRRAIEAFKEEKHVVVSGRLVLDGRQYAVEAPTDFVVLD